MPSVFYTFLWSIVEYIYNYVFTRAGIKISGPLGCYRSDAYLYGIRSKTEK